jgi:hypothetical protein
MQISIFALKIAFSPQVGNLKMPLRLGKIILRGPKLILDAEGSFFKRARCSSVAHTLVAVGIYFSSRSTL